MAERAGQHPRFAIRLAWGLAAVSVPALVASVVLFVLDRAAIDTSTLVSQAGWLVNAVICVALGLLIVVRRPGNPIGWLLLSLGAGNLLLNLPEEFAAIRGLQTGAGHAGWVAWCTWMFSWTGIGGGVLLGFTVFFFPDGRLRGRLWTWVLWFDIAGGAVLAACAMLDTTPVQITSRLPSVANPIGVAAVKGPLSLNGNGFVPVALIVLMLLSAAASAVVRFRHSSGVARRQLRWFALSFAAAVAITVVGFGVGPINADFDIVGSIGFDIGIGILLPGTIGLAVMRYGLYDIDVFISRAIVYGSLAAFITSVYVGIAVGVGALVGSNGKPNLGLSILATAVVAAGFQPARERLQHIANRLVYGERATPYEVLAQFSEQAAQSYAVEEVMPRMARALAQGTAAQRADVWLRSGDTLRPAAVWPASAPPPQPLELDGDSVRAMAGATRVVAVRHHGEMLGALSVSKPQNESLSATEENLLLHLANQAGLLLRNVRLTADLQLRLDELRASRQRLVTAQDEERRRIERNLHDGAQQHLVALKVKLSLLEMLLDRDVDKARGALEQLRSDADDALETLRDLARGIYPPLLADKGLTAALQSQARKATLPVELDVDGTGRYPAEVEAAVYFCVLEALQNVQKYAGASRATVRLREEDGMLRFEVSDDGSGFETATARRGSGLTNMADRLDALAGTLDVESAPGRGSRLRGAIPVAATAGQAATP